MRTRTNINYGSGTSGFVKLIKNFYSAVNVNVVYSEKSVAEELCRELTLGGYNADLRPVNRVDFPRKGFTVGIGDERVVRFVKSYAPGGYAYYPTFICPELLTRGENGFAEFCYIDIERINVDDKLAAAECHCTLFSAFTDGLSVFYSDKGRPYSDKGLTGLLKNALEILTGGADREEFIDKALRSAGMIIDLLHSRGVNKLTSAEMGYYMGGGLQNRYSAAYFLNRLLILFTKWNFRDMLIPSEKPVNGVSNDAKPRYGNEELFLTGAELRKITGRVREYTAKPEIKKLVVALKNTVEKQNLLFAEIYNRGIPEGLIDYG